MLTRTGHDSLGPFGCPRPPTGACTARAVRNFPSAARLSACTRRLVAALGAVKLAAARANHDLGLLDDLGTTPSTAAQGGPRRGVRRPVRRRRRPGRRRHLDEHERQRVIANRALEISACRSAGTTRCTPLDRPWNRCQSTNDVYPTAVRLALVAVVDRLNRRHLAELAEAFARKATEFRGVPKIGHTAAGTPSR